jgi:predicted metalloprotease with PDZ domain
MYKFRFLTALSFALVFVSFSYSQETTSENSYRYSINLNDVKNHELPVTLITPNVDKDEIIFRMPKMIPGTYHVYNFGRFVSDFKAYDKEGKSLPVEEIDSSSWKISGAGSLAKITYRVRETWHPENRNNFVFEPAGTNFDKSKSFVINNNAVFGYFDDMKKMQYDINITKPLNFYGATGMVPVYTDDTLDKFVTPDYYELVDMPLMYTNPDTTVIKVGGTDVLISVYSESKIITSKMLAREIGKLLEAQKNYLGGSLPVKKYAYLVYFDDHTNSGSAGALEHSYSSLYYLVEGDTEYTKKAFIDPAAHEFFHIITPLSIHSEEIQDFDFANPKMSEHLWLYEGVTEYSAGIVQVKEGLITGEQFLTWLKNKMLVSGYFNDTLPFTVMSKKVLDKYQNQYVNVYYKGALIGMCLDIKLRSLSRGKYGIKKLLEDLSKRYGKEKAFKDSELFSVITEMTYPEIRKFFSDYVEGPNHLPLEEIFDLVGVNYVKSGRAKVFTLGGISLNINTHEDYVKVVNVSDMNDFGQEMGYKEGDQIVTINGKRLHPAEYNDFINDLFSTSKEGDELEMVVLRTGEDGKTKKVTLKAPMVKIEREVADNLSFEEDPAEEQLKIRKAWLGKD